MKTMERTDGNVFSKYQDNLAQIAKLRPDLRVAIQKELSAHSIRTVGRGAKNAVILSSHQIEMVMRAYEYQAPADYLKIQDRAMAAYLSAKGDKDDCQMINMPETMLGHVLQGLEENIHSRDSAELRKYLITWFNVERERVGLPTYYYDHANKDNRKAEDEPYDGGFELSADNLAEEV